MPVNAHHPEYARMAAEPAQPGEPSVWEQVRDSLAGENAIKRKKHQYLPPPPGIDQPWATDDPAYLNYLRRAVYPDILAPTIQGMLGLMARKDAQINLPPSLDRLRKRATPDGLDLDGLLVRLRHEVLALGRYVLFVDAPEEGGTPFIATYSAESLINWRSDGERLTMMVFEETVREPNPDDPFVEESVTQWRVAMMEGAADDQGRTFERYVVRVYRRQVDDYGKESFYVDSEAFPQGRGDSLDRVPAVVVGSRDLLPDPDQVPLLGVVNGAKDLYRQTADYRLGLFSSAQVTPYVIGATITDSGDGGDVIRGIGPSQLWEIQNQDAKVGYLEVSAAGLDAQRQAIEDTKADIRDAAMRVLGEGRRGAEAAEALRLRFQSQTATLSSIARSTAEGLQAALRMIAQWEGADAAQVEVTPSLDFIHDEPDAQVLQVLGDLIERGLMPDEALSGYARRTNLTDASDDEFRALAPAFMAQPSGDDEG